MKARLDLPGSHRRVLEVILERIRLQNLRWVLTGSCSLRLQGVDLSVHDVDLQADAGSVRQLEICLADFMKTPVRVWESAHTRSLHGMAEIEGVQVELLGDVTHRRPDGSWGPPADFSGVRWVEWQGLRVPVFPLEAEADDYEAMGRAEKAALIRNTAGQLKERHHD